MKNYSWLRFADPLLQALINNNKESVREITFNLNMKYLFKEIPQEDFSILVSLLEEKSLTTSRCSSYYVYFFQSHWYHITKKQRILLLPYLERLFRITADWMTCFSISELLGEEYGNKSSFSTARRLSRTEKPKNRQFVPHIFEHLVTDCKDTMIQRKAMTELKKMQNDSVSQVRNEVKISLRRIKRRRQLRFGSKPYVPRIDYVYGNDSGG